MRKQIPLRSADNKHLAGSIGEGRDNVPGPAAVPNLTPAPPTDAPVPLTAALQHLRATSARFTAAAEEFEQAWTRFLCEELSRREPALTFVWLADTDGDLYTLAQLADGTRMPVHNLPDGLAAEQLCLDYYYEVFPTGVIDVVGRRLVRPSP
ncbi:MAG: hypothetical protein QG597_4016 [Actinomycetota bacterium]|jgi:hypothetical protein|nr:hypothetical protein [Actinomycetota bacterium]